MTREEMKKLLGEGVDEKIIDSVMQAMREGEERAATEMQEKYEEQLRAMEEKEKEAQFQAMVDEVLRGMGCRSLRAAKALMDMEALRNAGGGMKEAIRKAAEALSQDEEGAFLFRAESSGRKLNIGGNGFKESAKGGSMAAIRRAAGLK
jgi:hypothetical protein